MVPRFRHTIIRLLLPLLWVACLGLGHAQVTPGGFRFSVLPPSNTVFVTETTNVFKITIEDWENVTNRYSNLVINAIVPTNRYTTNLHTTNYVVGTNMVFRFADVGSPPNETPDDGIFVGDVITPTTPVYTNFTVQIIIAAIDLTPDEPSPDPDLPVIAVWRTNITYTIVTRPLNDMFTNAFKIDPMGGVSVGTNNFASIEFAEKTHAGVRGFSSSVWWNWSAGATTNVLIDTAGSVFNPILAVYTGDSITNLTLVGSSTNDVINQLQANLNFNAVRGTTYRIVVSGYTSNNVGEVRVRVALGARPDKTPPALVISTPNRESASASELLVVSGTARESSILESGIARVMLQVNNLPPTNASGTVSWSGLVTLPAGTNVVRAYAIDYAGNVGPADAVVVRFVSPTNDLFSAATRITGVGGVFTTQNRTATRESGEPLHAGNEGGHSIWYSFRTASAGVLSVTTQGSSFDTVLGLYLGDALTNLAEVASNDDAFDGSHFSSLQTQVLSNQLYYIAVDGYGGSRGTSVVQVAFVPPAAGQFYAITVDALPGGQASPPGGAYPSGARVTLTATPDRDYEFVGWDGTIVSSANPLTLTVNQNLSLLARFRIGTTNYTEDFEDGRFRLPNWGNSTSSPWTALTNSPSTGRYSLRAGPVGHGQRTSLVLTTNTAAGTGSFDLRVSSEPEWDYLEFYINNVLKQRWSGDIAWTNFPFTVQAGTNRFEWRYAKDVNFSDGLDTAFIDNIYIPIVPATTGPGTAVLAAGLLPNRQIQLTIVGDPGRSYAIEATADFVFWIPLGTTNSPSGVIQFIDRQAPSIRQRYYRTIAR